MYYNRLIDKHLLDWMVESPRKPLLLRGARQVGKSSAVRELARQFEYFLEVNFEETPSVATLFSGDLRPEKITADLQAFYNRPIIPGKTLLFFDEIQSCPAAIASLRFFYERMPDLHVIAAGSLLEFALQELPSFGVGRIRSLFMYPFSFDEFLWAMGEQLLFEAKMKASANNPLSEAIHLKLVDSLKSFLITGGMPEAVTAYVESGNYLKSQRVLDDLYLAFRTDFAKYRNRVPAQRLSHVFEAVIHQTGGKFVLSKAAPELSHNQIKDALELLIMAGLVIPVTHSAANGLPIGAEADPKKRKMIPFDTGILQRILGLSLSEWVVDEAGHLTNKGAMAEVLFGLEYIKYSAPWEPPALYYWHRESPGSNAEVDYIMQKGNSILPVEIKSSQKGGMQSLRRFIKEKGHAFGYRFSLEPFSAYDDVKVMPLYAVSHLFEATRTLPP